MGCPYFWRLSWIKVFCFVYGTNSAKMSLFCRSWPSMSESDGFKPLCASIIPCNSWNKTLSTQIPIIWTKMFKISYFARQFLAYLNESGFYLQYCISRLDFLSMCWCIQNLLTTKYLSKSPKTKIHLLFNLQIFCQIISTCARVTSSTKFIIWLNRRAPHELFPQKAVPHQFPAGLDILRKFILAWRF